MDSTNSDSLPFVCGAHGETLHYVLKGGAGYCSQCRLFVQSANHEMPTLDQHVLAKREGEAAAKLARKRSGKIKAVPVVTTHLQQPQLKKARLIKREVAHA